MKILITILSTDFEPYLSLERGIRKTWFSTEYPNIEKIFYCGNHPKTELKGDKLYIQENEDLMNIGHKTIKMFEFILSNFNFDYLFRTNSSSYVDQKILYEFVSDKPRNNFYSAIIGYYNGVEYGSGSGYFLSRDLVEYVVNNKDKWDHSFIDDVSLGKLLKSNKIKIHLGNRFDVTNSNIHNIDKNYYHYRVKQEHNRDLDIQIMEIIHNLKKSN